MKSKEEILSMLFATLHELQNTTPSDSLKSSLQTRLGVLNNILDDDDIPEEYWEQIEEQL